VTFLRKTRILDDAACLIRSTAPSKTDQSRQADNDERQARGFRDTLDLLGLQLAEDRHHGRNIVKIELTITIEMAPNGRSSAERSVVVGRAVERQDEGPHIVEIDDAVEVYVAEQSGCQLRNDPQFDHFVPGRMERQGERVQVVGERQRVASHQIDATGLSRIATEYGKWSIAVRLFSGNTLA
jgi:hypothetical protein